MKGRRVRLTDAGVGKLKPDATEYAVWDSEVPGLGVRVPGARATVTSGPWTFCSSARWWMCCRSCAVGG